MRVLMEIRRSGAKYEGSVTRVGDELCLPFTGLLELLAVLERLEPHEADAPPERGAGGGR